MFKNPNEAIKFAGANKIEMIDLKFIDLFGRWHHLSLPKSQLNMDMFKRGVPFDGSSTPGFKAVESGDMTLLPDVKTAKLDPFWDVPTLSFICSSAEVDTLKLYKREPRAVAHKAEQYLIKTGIADQSLWSTEFEF